MFAPQTTPCDNRAGLLGNDDINTMTLIGGAVTMGTVGGATLMATMAFPGQIVTGLAIGGGALAYGHYQRTNDNSTGDASTSTVTVDATPTVDSTPVDDTNNDA